MVVLPGISRKLFVSLVVVSWLVLVAGQGRAVGVKIGGDETWAKLGLLLQGRASFSRQGAPDGRSLDSDLYLRRLRVLLWGQLDERINFFVQTDNPNLGRGGDFSSRMYVQDAWVEINLLPGLQIDAGMLLVPFSHHGMQGAVSLHAVDYHSALVRYPAGSNLVWRDYGVMIRGLLLNGMFDYRLAVLNGVNGDSDDPRNPHDLPRLAARLTANVFEAEGGAGVGGFFYDGIYLKGGEQGLVSPRRILSLGLSVDWQADLNVALAGDSGEVTGRSDYLGMAADVFFDLPLDEPGLLGLVGQANFYYYDHGDRRAHPDGSPSSFYDTEAGCATCVSGYGVASEIGLRYDAWEVLAALDWFAASSSDDNQGDLLAVYGGVNWWWQGHATSLKLQVGGARHDGGDWGLTGQLQVQLLF